MRIVITGSAGGLGSYLTQRMRTAGHTVLGVDSVGGEHCLPPEDGYGDSKYWAAAEIALGGPIEGAVLAHGITAMAWSEDHSLESFRKVLEVNLTQSFSLIQAIIQRDVAAGTRFVAIGSASAHQAMSQSHGYVASKAGLEALMRVFARDLADRSEHLFFTIAPGSFEGGGMTRAAFAEVQARGFSPDKTRRHLARNPLGRLTSLEEIAKVVDFCLFEAPQAMSGTTFKLPMCSGVE